MSLAVEKFELVIPGQFLGRGQYRTGRGVYKLGEDEYYASRTGLINIRHNKLYLVPLSGSVYYPRKNDVVIGRIEYVGMSTWKVDIGSAYSGILSIKSVIDRRNNYRGRVHDISKILDEGDLILTKIVKFDRTSEPILSMRGRRFKKLESGRLVEIKPVKIPRVIGKSGSMISMIKKETNSRLIVGKNGRILVNAPNFKAEKTIIEALKKIEEQSHVSGLTNRIHEFIKDELQKESN